MKNKKFLFLSLLILVIGFAAVSTTLYISGNLVFGTNKNDFDIYFSGAIIDDEDKSNEVILSDKKHIEYESKELKTLGDTSVLEFEVTNNSTQYDAKVSISCTLSDNEYITYTTDKNEYNIPAQTRESGKVIVELIKASTSILNPTISCELVSTAEERSATAETVITDSSYEITGTLTDEEGNILANKNLVVYSETPHYVTTDDYGFFYVNGLEKGSHEIYYVNTEDATGKTKEEVKGLAESEAKITTNSTKINFENIQLNDFKIKVEKEEEINITLDADTGSIDSNTLKINKYEKGSELPTPIPKSSNYEFLGWYDGEKKITNNTIITREMSLVAKWNKKCQYDEGFIWNYDYTGSSQTFTSPCDGIYKLEVWGAQGGRVTYSGYAGYAGGKGAYSSGNTFINESVNLYIYVGGSGSNGGSSRGAVLISGGFNGGGSNGSLDGMSPGGGGATDIRVTGGTWNNVNSLNSRIIVAGGGGGSGILNYGAPGGIGSGIYSTLYGGNGTQTNGGSAGTGYTHHSGQTAGGFGYGGTGGGYGVGAGGAGWYGGGGGAHITPSSSGGGGGGSSYVKGCLGCNTSFINYQGDFLFENIIMTAGNSSFPNITNTGNEIGHSGNGYAKITLVSLD